MSVLTYHVSVSQAADADRDGQVSDTEFGTMINVATAAQKRYVVSEVVLIKCSH